MVSQATIVLVVIEEGEAAAILRRAMVDVRLAARVSIV